MLPTTAKLLFTYLITSPSSHLSGIYYLPLTTVSHETSLSQKETTEAFSLLADSDLVAYDDATNTVWVKNMLRHQGRGQKIIKSVEYQLASLHNSKLIKLFLEYYRELKIGYRYPFDTLSKGGTVLPSPVPSPSSDLSSLNGEGREEESLPSEAIKCAQFLSDKIFENFPKRTAPTKGELMTWARDADKIHRIDGHSWEDIRDLLAWSQADSFWKPNILSMGKFRKQWNQLIAKKQAGGQTKADQLRNRNAAFLSRGLK